MRLVWMPKSVGLADAVAALRVARPVDFVVVDAAAPADAAGVADAVARAVRAARLADDLSALSGADAVA